MNKAELITKISENSNFSKKDSEIFLNAFIDSVTTSLANGDKIQLVGFGAFEVKERAEKKGRNPQTNTEIIIPATKAPLFKAGKLLKEAVNK